MRDSYYQHFYQWQRLSWLSASQAQHPQHSILSQGHSLVSIIHSHRIGKTTTVTASTWNTTGNKLPGAPILWGFQTGWQKPGAVHSKACRLDGGYMKERGRPTHREKFFWRMNKETGGGGGVEGRGRREEGEGRGGWRRERELVCGEVPDKIICVPASYVLPGYTS